MSEVAPGIHRVEFPFADRLASSYLLVGSEAVLVVDTGVRSTPAEWIAPYLERIGVGLERVRWVIASHADLDHHGGHAAMRALVPDAVFACHEADRAMVEDPRRLFSDRYDGFRDPHGIAEPDSTLDWCLAEGEGTATDLTLAGGEWISLGDGWRVEVLHLPGHSRGHLGLRDPRSGALIIQDAVLGDGLPGADGALVAPPTYRWVDDYLATVELLERLRPPLLLTAHFPLFGAEAGARFVALSRDCAERIERQLREQLDASPDGLTTAELVSALGPLAGPWPEAARAGMVFPIAGHLERLAAQGLLDAQPEGGRVRWRPRTG
jgi:glyoxylase-like metal-dependent hydrolase (beta-lactamase superfamily II)